MHAHARSGRAKRAPLLVIPTHELSTVVIVCMQAHTYAKRVYTHLQQHSHRQTDKHVGAHTLMHSQEHINTHMHGCLHAHAYAHSHTITIIKVH